MTAKTIGGKKPDGDVKNTNTTIPPKKDGMGNGITMSGYEVEMTEPDYWVIVHIKSEYEELDKVLGGWSGGYLDGDAWQINSGIESIEDDEDYWYFHGFSGSIYKCHKGAERLMGMAASVYSKLENSDVADVSIIKAVDIKLG